MSLIVFVFFGSCVLVIALHSLFLIDLIRINQFKKPINRSTKKFDSLPVVTVQLPIFNELNVVDGLVDSIMKLDYPKELLEVQILDDSTDETFEIAMQKAEEYRKLGYDIKVIHRENRQGFKGGALAEATPKAKGEFLAIFDADFKPEPDFLKRVLPFFEDNVACVQTKWGHINGFKNWFTVSQVIALDVFYVEEQEARSRKDYYLRFNGSGGVWRKTAIAEAGGWSGDTLCEDLDLAYRAQMKGWEFRYDRSNECPAEIPENLTDLKRQQYRWAFGKVQVIKKILKDVLTTPMRFDKKSHALADLFNLAAAVAITVMAITSIPASFSMKFDSDYQIAWSFLIVGTIYYPVILYMTFSTFRYHFKTRKKSILMMIKYFVPFSILFTGITWHQCLAVVDELRGKKVEFQRTPKFVGTESIKKAYKVKRKISYGTVIEILGTFYFIYGIYNDIAIGFYAFLPFHITMTLALGGFAYHELFGLRLSKGKEAHFTEEKTAKAA
jgi:cellulose synthase/poly-beta-1,6-N-acetylglucosamine synthase-like glycosyltransferase